jgi:hypothetical protein
VFGRVYEVHFPERRSGSQPTFPVVDLSIMLQVAELNVWPKKLYRWAASLSTVADALVFPGPLGS